MPPKEAKDAVPGPNAVLPSATPEPTKPTAIPKVPNQEPAANLTEALARAQRRFTPVPKNRTATVQTRTGGTFTYRYADLGDCLNMALPILADEGIAFTQPLTRKDDGKLYVVTIISYHPAGGTKETEMSDGLPLTEGLDPQVFGGQLTYWRRYDGCSFLGIAPEEDTDSTLVDPKVKRAEGRTEREIGSLKPGEANRGHQREGFDQSPLPTVKIDGKLIEFTDLDRYRKPLLTSNKKPYVKFRVQGLTEWISCYHVNTWAPRLKAALGKEISVVCQVKTVDGQQGKVTYYNFDHCLRIGDQHYDIKGEPVKAPTVPPPGPLCAKPNPKDDTQICGLESGHQGECNFQPAERLFEE
jgi:hypothetical protein